MVAGAPPDRHVCGCAQASARLSPALASRAAAQSPEPMHDVQVRKQLAALGVSDGAATRILTVMSCRSIGELQAALGPSEAVDELQLLFQLAEGYGYGDWLEYDASVVRGLAYYTGAPLLATAVGAVGSALPVHAHAAWRPYRLRRLS